MPERERRGYPVFERVTHLSPILAEGALTWYGLNYLTRHSSDPFFWLSTRSGADELVGEEDKIKALANHIDSSPSGSLATIVGPFGSGKTGFVYRLMDELISSGKMKEEEIQWVATSNRDWNKIYTITDILAKNPPVPPRLIVLEENERIQRQDHEDSFTMLGLLLPEIPFLVLTGESTLKDPQFFKLIGVDPSKVYSVEMDPITPESLKEALKARMLALFGEYAQSFNPDKLFDPEFLNYLIPNTNPPVATYREILGKIVGMAQYGLGEGLVDRELRNQPAQINGELYRKVWQDSPSGIEKSYVDKVTAGLHRIIRTTHNPSMAFQPLPYEKLIELGLFEGLDAPGEERERNGKRNERLRNLLLWDVVKEVGDSKLTPKSNSDKTFIPTVKTFLNARYNPLSS